MASKRATYTQEDTTALPEAVGRAMREYSASLGPIRVSDLLMEFGSKRGLAEALASETGTKVDSQMKNISRWLNYEAGQRGSQARDPNRSRATLNRLRSQMTARRPPRSMSITITGWIGYDDKYYFRTIHITLPGNGAAVSNFLENMQKGDTHQAYQDVFQAYKVGRGVISVADDNPEISIDFDPGDMFGQEE
jgi:hypothetical protein